MAAMRWQRCVMMGLGAVVALQMGGMTPAHARHHHHRHEESRDETQDTQSGQGGYEGSSSRPQPIASPVPEACDDGKFLADLQAAEGSSSEAHADRVEHVCGKVIAVSASKRTRSGLHGYFYVDVGHGVSIRIVSDLDRMSAPAWPWVAKGDQTDVLGRYYYDNARSQGIDWTHHGTGRSWPVEGYVSVNGTRYQ